MKIKYRTNDVKVMGFVQKLRVGDLFTISDLKVELNMNQNQIRGTIRWMEKMGKIKLLKYNDWLMFSEEKKMRIKTYKVMV